MSCIGIGGYHLGIPRDEQETTRLIGSAVDRGITFMDNCWDYHGGESERRMGNALRDGYRQVTHQYDGTFQNPQWLG